MTCLFDRLAEHGIELRHFREGTQRLPCPECDRGARDSALAVTVEHDGAVWICHRCGFKGAVRDRGESAMRPPQKPQAPRSESERHETLAPRWREFWDACEPVAHGCVAGRYLSGRGCALPPEDGDLRWHPEAFHWPTQTRRAALVGLISDAVSNAPISLHMTFLRVDGSGKADIERPRLLLPRHRKAGGVIRLWPDDCVTHGLAIAEGVETSLTLAKGYSPTWCAIDAGNLRDLQVLAGIEHVVVAVDYDVAGLKAAQAFADRWTRAGATVDLLVPSQPGRDINDEVQAA